MIEYTCAVCGKTYEQGQTDEEALDEYRKKFPGCEEDDKEVVCDDCYNELFSEKQLGVGMSNEDTIDTFEVNGATVTREEFQKYIRNLTPDEFDSFQTSNFVQAAMLVHGMLARLPADILEHIINRHRPSDLPRLIVKEENGEGLT